MIRQLVIVYLRILYSWLKTAMYCFVWLAYHRSGMAHSLRVEYSQPQLESGCVYLSWFSLVIGFSGSIIYSCRSQWPRDLRCRSAVARLLRSWVRIPWMFVCCEYCVLSGRGLCDELITRPEESYRKWCVAVCDLETSRLRRSWPALGRSATRKKNLQLDIGIITGCHDLQISTETLATYVPNVLCFQPCVMDVALAHYSIRKQPYNAE